MAEEKDEWYLSRKGETSGPMGFAELQKLAEDGEIEPRVDVVMGGEQDDWVQAAEVPGLFKPAGGEDSDESHDESPATRKRRMSEPLADVADFDEDEEEVIVYDLPGANRLGYFAGVYILPFILMFALAMALPAMRESVGESYDPFLSWLFLIPFILIIVVTVKRFQNLAMTGWWFFGLSVPFLHFWLYYRLFACPPGYAYTKRLDGIGWVLAILYWLFVLAVPIMIIMFIMMFSWQEILDNLGLEELKKEINTALEEMREQADSARGRAR